MLIKATDFKGEVFVSSTLEEFGNANELQYYIDKYASQLLLFALGKTLFDELKLQLDVNGDLLPTAPQEWVDFVAKAKQPLLFYVFWYYYQNGNVQIKLNIKNATILSSRPTLAYVWNEFIRLYQSNCNELYPQVYSGWFGVFVDYLGTENTETSEQSLVQFVRETFDFNESHLFRTNANTNRLGI